MQSVLNADKEIYLHCVRVGNGSKLLAEAAGLGREDQQSCELAGLFHDIGKTEIPRDILYRPAKLSHDEMKVVKKHPIWSVEKLLELRSEPEIERCIPGVLHHHERFDGAGYPQGLKGEAIPLVARVVLIADAYDAMTSNRTYRQGMTLEEARFEIEEYAGLQFDPKLVKVFLKNHRNWLDYRKTVFTETSSFLLKTPA